VPKANDALEPEPVPGLRIRKKQKTRLAIQDAALELFGERGFEGTTVEEIAARAEVSTATFFRYFGTKGEVIFGGNGYEHEVLEQSIIARPQTEDDLTALRSAVREGWLPQLDQDLVARQVRASAKSPVLRGMSAELGARFQSVIADALARRRKLKLPDQRCRLTAAVVFAVFSNATNTWSREGFREDLARVIDREFDLMLKLSAEWSRSGVNAQARARRDG
jgi:AcrR family transcriptional regulator